MRAPPSSLDSSPSLRHPTDPSRIAAQHPRFAAHTDWRERGIRKKSVANPRSFSMKKMGTAFVRLDKCAQKMRSDVCVNDCDDVNVPLRLFCAQVDYPARMSNATLSGISLYIKTSSVPENCAVHRKKRIQTLLLKYLLCCAPRHQCCTTGEKLHTSHGPQQAVAAGLKPWLLQRRAFGVLLFATRTKLKLSRKNHMVRFAKRGSTGQAKAVQRAAWSTK